MTEIFPTNVAPFLESTFCVDSAHPAVVAYANANVDVSASLLDQGVSLYYAVRDGFRYNPWAVETGREAFRASAVLQRDPAEGHCIDKATVLAAVARSRGIPSRLRFANVRNHIGTEELERQLGSDVLVFHGYVDLYLEGQWVAATPAFNKELCAHLGVTPLPFDGRSDSIFQEFDAAGGRFMEYLHHYGTFADIPFELMIAEWSRYYPAFMREGRWPSRDSGAKS